jgi:hypothetical protein
MSAFQGFSMEVPSGQPGQNSNLKVFGPSQARITADSTLVEGSIMLIHATMTHPSHSGKGTYVWLGRRTGPEVNGFISYKLTYMLFLTSDGQLGSDTGGGSSGPQGVTVAVTVTDSTGTTGATSQPVTVE